MTKVKSYTIDGSGNVINVRRTVNVMAVLLDSTRRRLVEELAVEISIHKALCESWYIVKNGEREVVEEAILDREDRLDKIMEEIKNLSKGGI